MRFHNADTCGCVVRDLGRGRRGRLREGVLSNRFWYQRSHSLRTDMVFLVHAFADDVALIWYHLRMRSHSLDMDI